MAKKRGNHEGSICQLPSGTWRAQITLQGNRLSFTAKSRKECQQWLKQINRQNDEGVTFQGTKITLGQFLDSWLISVKTRVRPGTWYQYEMTCRLYIFPVYRNLKLNDLTAGHIQLLYNARVKAGANPRTVRVIHVVLHSALEHALKLGLIGRNPAKAVTPPRYQPEEMKFYDDIQVNHLLRVARGDRNEVLYHLAVVTGMRQSELLALKWSDLDWQKQTLRVQRQLKRGDHQNGYFTAPKTRAGKRTISLGAITITQLRKHYERQRLERLAANESWKENDLIFPSTIGTPIDQHNLLKAFKRLVHIAGLPEIRFHDLRHTAASLMLNHGIPAIVVARRLGHSKVSITLDTYGHLMPEMQNEAAELMDELVTPVAIDLPKTTHELHTDAESE